MRIAFDVKGTLEGPKKNILLVVFAELQKRGHECVVWSNSYGYAVDAVRDNDLNAEAMSKTTKWDVDDDQAKFVDVAIDDDSSQTWLAAKRFIWVHEIETAGWLLNKILGESK
jgi:threonine dehydrogenase-like Zn-dependent dehydrogenase